MTRRDRVPWMRPGRTLERPFSSLTVGREACTNLYSATSPQVTAGVSWLTRDDPFLEPPPGKARTLQLFLFSVWWSDHASFLSLSKFDMDPIKVTILLMLHLFRCSINCVEISEAWLYLRPTERKDSAWRTERERGRGFFYWQRERGRGAFYY